MAKSSQKALRQLGLLRRVFGRFELVVFTRLYTTYIRPHVEYASQAWQPWLIRDKKLLELPQRKATKCIRGMYNLPYHQRLCALGLFSVSYRQLRGDMILVFQILTTENHPCRHLLNLSEFTKLRGHTFKLQHHYSRLDCRRNFFSLRVCRTWNMLPSYITDSTSLDMFKHRLDYFLSDRSFTYLWWDNLPILFDSATPYGLL
jgi:hypothetical protein